MMRCKEEVYMYTSENPAQCQLDADHPLPHSVLEDDGLFLWPFESVRELIKRVTFREVSSGSYGVKADHEAIKRLYEVAQMRTL